MANFTNPTTATLYASVIAELKARDDDIATMFRAGTETNIPVNSVRWNSVANTFEVWTGVVWSNLSSQYNINVQSLGGFTSSAFLRLAGGSQTFTSGILTLASNTANPLAIKGGTADRVYLEFFPYASNTNLRGAYLGFSAAATGNFNIVNEYADSPINLTTNGTGSVNLTTDSCAVLSRGVVGLTNVRTTVGTSYLINQATNGASYIRSNSSGTNSAVFEFTNGGGNIGTISMSDTRTFSVYMGASTQFYCTPTSIGSGTSSNITLGNVVATRDVILELGSTVVGGGSSIVDFHSSANLAADYNARIQCSGGTATAGSGAITYTASSHRFQHPNSNTVVQSFSSNGYASFSATSSGTDSSYIFFSNAGGEKSRITVTDAGNMILGNINKPTHVYGSGNLGAVHSASTTLGSQVAGAAALELGSVVAGGSSSFIGFHSSGGLAAGANARITCSGGTSTNYSGIMTYNASQHNFLGETESASTVLSSSYNVAAIQVRELSKLSSQTGVNAEAPRLAFHWGGRYAAQIGIDTNKLRTFNNPGTGYEPFHANSFRAYDGSLVEQIIIDPDLKKITIAGDAVPTIDAAPVTGHNYVGSLYFDDGDGILADVLNVSGSTAEGVWTTVGPTGSGATVIWTALDSVPLAATSINVTTYLHTLLTSTATGSLYLYARYGDATVAGIHTKYIVSSLRADGGVAEATPVSSSSVSKHSSNVVIRLNSNNIFYCQWLDFNAQVPVVEMIYTGYYK